ncbi:MAG: phosphoribosylglycinamide formyltransferase [Desulfuromonadales bacterium]|nr:phosphoribosylglycinamide formyltransferase [Desulfuromonadales bacterium]
MSKKLRIGAIASGGGTNLQAIIDRCADGSLQAEIVLVISNNPDAGALDRGKRAGIPTLCIDHRHYSDREDFDQQIVAALKTAGADTIVLAGFMRIVTDTILNAFPQRVLNIHPALLPAFPGLHVQRKALEYGARFAGCTVHFVDSGVDTGPIIAQAVVPVLDDDTEQTLSARILIEEHRLYPHAIQLLAEDRLKIDGRRVRIEPTASPLNTTLINPPLSDKE